MADQAAESQDPQATLELFGRTYQQGPGLAWWTCPHGPSLMSTGPGLWFTPSGKGAPTPARAFLHELLSPSAACPADWFCGLAPCGVPIPGTPYLVMDGLAYVPFYLSSTVPVQGPSHQWASQVQDNWDALKDLAFHRLSGHSIVLRDELRRHRDLKKWWSGLQAP